MAQAEQVAAPLAEEKNPAEQLKHCEVPVLSSYFPASQLEQEVAPEAEYLPVEQLKQLAAAVKPVAVEYKPEGQPRQLDDPLADW